MSQQTITISTARHQHRNNAFTHYHHFPRFFRAAVVGGVRGCTGADGVCCGRSPAAGSQPQSRGKVRSIVDGRWRMGCDCADVCRSCALMLHPTVDATLIVHRSSHLIHHHDSWFARHCCLTWAMKLLDRSSVGTPSIPRTPECGQLQAVPLSASKGATCQHQPRLGQLFLPSTLSSPTNLIRSDARSPQAETS